MKTIYTTEVITTHTNETRQFTVRVFRGKYEVLVQRNGDLVWDSQFKSTDLDWIMRNVNQMVSNLESAKVAA